MSIDSSMNIVIPVAVDSDGVAGVSLDGKILIGTGKDLEPGSFCSGLIDDVQLYDETITIEEIVEMVLELDAQAKCSEQIHTFSFDHRSGSL